MNLFHPLVILIAITATLGFEALLFGGDVVQSAMPSIPAPPNFSSCSAEASLVNPLGPIPCYVGQVFYTFVFVVIIIFGFIFFLFNLIFFNVPGAPTIVKVIVGTSITMALLYSILGMLRGGGTRS